MSTIGNLFNHWIDKRGGAYLAKENTIVYFASLTGREQDQQWHKLTLAESVRIIRAMEMGLGGDDLTQSHVITACQELGRVYEFGLSSTHTLPESVFNYMKEAGSDTHNEVARLIAERLKATDYHAIRHAEVRDILFRIFANLDLNLSTIQTVDVMHKHFVDAGYQIKQGPHRVMFDGRKTTALMLHGTKPRDMKDLYSSEQLISEFTQKFK